jgi:SAM-dependent methyltransferase
MARNKQRFARPAPDRDFRDPLGAADGLGWLGGDVQGLDVLCLAAGGGRQSALYAAAGARVTVVDISAAMLELDRQVAAERNLEIRTVEASMDNLTAIGSAAFDVVIQPVSTCYVPDLTPVYREVARVTRPGAIYISQHKQPLSLQANAERTGAAYQVLEPYYRDGPLPAVANSRLREEGALEYLHRWEQIVGLMCRCGFVIEDLVEPMHADKNAAPSEFGHRSQFIPPYVRIKARRTGTADNGDDKLWTP